MHVPVCMYGFECVCVFTCMNVCLFLCVCVLCVCGGVVM